MTVSSSRLRLAVTGRDGQVARALLEASGDIDVIPLSRPVLDLERPETIADAIRAAAPDIVVNAAAFTAVDQAETTPDTAFLTNAVAAGAVAAAAASLDVPVIQISTDYVFDGRKPAPYVESDPTGPLGVYGASKLAGEQAVAAATPNHVILRTSWVYAPFGKNFVRTMLRLGEHKEEISVVSDQFGCPTYAPDIADAIIAVATNLATRPHNPELRGLFHLAGSGDTSWADLADAIFVWQAMRGGRAVRVVPISTDQYPTLARRPMNSRLDCHRLAATHDVRLPDWRSSLVRCLERLASAADDGGLNKRGGSL